MRRTVCLALGLIAVMAGSVGAGDPTDLKALIDRVLEAHGGAEKLAQPRAYSFKQEVTQRAKKAADGSTTKATYYFQLPKQFRTEEESQRGGRTSKYIEVVSGNRGWAKRDGTALPPPLESIKHPIDVQQGYGYKFILLLRDPTW